MIKIKIQKEEITITGHANFADYGQDIVCASVSSIVTTTINAILSFDEKALVYEENKDKLNLEKLKKDNITETLLKNMIRLLKELAQSYPQNIKIIEEEN